MNCKAQFECVNSVEPAFGSTFFQQRAQVLVESEAQVTQMVDSIRTAQVLARQSYIYFEAGEDLTIGIDCEGISRKKNLSLIQIGVNGQCFVVDLTKVNPFPLGLKDILEDRNIIKVIHDVCEDLSALVNQFGVHCERVFDTQIAHRLLHKDSNNPKDQNISLNALLYQYLRVENTQKNSINICMNEDPAFWHKRPLSQEMLDYASQDVLYLPQMYESFKAEICKKLKKQNEKKQSPAPSQPEFDQSYDDSGVLYQGHSDHDDGNISTSSSSNQSEDLVSLFQKEWDEFLHSIFEHTELAHRYAYLNKKAPVDFYFPAGTQIQALLKNFQPFGVFCSLNLGVSGLVKCQSSLDVIRSNHKLGDVITLEVAEDFSSSEPATKPLILLRLPESFTQKQLLSDLIVPTESRLAHPFYSAEKRLMTWEMKAERQEMQGFYFDCDLRSDNKTKLRQSYQQKWVYKKRKQRDERFCFYDTSYKSAKKESVLLKGEAKYVEKKKHELDFHYPRKESCPHEFYTSSQYSPSLIKPNKESWRKKFEA